MYYSKINIDLKNNPISLYTFLSGGTGTPKLLEGFRNLIDDQQIGVICNTGDDLFWNQLHVSPDLDTILYLFAGKLDLSKFWGVTNETFHSLETLKSLDFESWFQIGDFDLGLHVARNDMLSRGMNLTEITQDICKSWSIEAKILPMCNQLVQSKIHTSVGVLSFQEFFVRERSNVDVKSITFEGNTQQTTPEVLELLDISKHIILGPSNPVTSMGPILALDPIRMKLEQQRKKTIAISPIVNELAFSGPTIKLMNAHKISPSVLGLASHYSKFVATLVISEEDKHMKKSIEDLDIEVVVLPIILQTQSEKRNLAQSIMELF